MFTLKIDTENDAFQDGNLELEVVRILQEVVKKIENGKDYATLIDVNGNKVGDFYLGNL